MENEIKIEILNKSIIGGLKFYDLKFNKTQDYVFDWQFVLNFSGGSAPYIQNAMARIDSIFYKLHNDIYDENTLNWNHEWSNDEKEIIFQTQKCKEIINDSTDDYASQTLSENIIKLCQLFHKYYESEIVIGSEKQEQKLNLLHHVYHSIENCIEILGINHYDCKQKMLNKIKKPKVK